MTVVPFLVSCLACIFFPVFGPGTSPATWLGLPSGQVRTWIDAPAGGSPGGVVLHIAGEGRELWGAWTEVEEGGIAIVRGWIDPAGMVRLDLDWGGLRRGRFEGRLAPLGGGLAGMLTTAGRATRSVVLGLPARAGIRFRSECRSVRGPGSTAPVRGGGRDALFSLSGLDVACPPGLEEWYRGIARSGMTVEAFAGSRFSSFVAAQRRTLGRAQGRGASGIRDVIPPAAEPGQGFFRERTSVLGEAGELVSTLTVREVSAEGRGSVTTSVFTVLHPGNRSRILPGDLFGPGWKERLAPLLESAARRQLGLAPGASLSGAGLFGPGIEPDGGFFVCSGGVGFGYDRFRLAPAARGDFRFLIPWNELNGMLDPGAVRRYGLGDLTK